MAAAALAAKESLIGLDMPHTGQQSSSVLHKHGDELLGKGALDLYVIDDSEPMTTGQP